MKNVNWYDEQCKKLLADKQVLLNILKREVDEYHGLSDEEILELICEPQLAQKDGDAPLESRNVVDQSIEKEKIEYDVLLYAGLPESEEKVGLIINLEVQGSEMEYPVHKRGIYYISRLLARQDGSDVGFRQPEYDRLKKVIGIWICRMRKKGIQNVYEIEEKLKGKKISFPKEEYDMMKLIVISPYDEASGEIGTMDLLSLLFGDKVSAEQMISRIEKDYGIKWSTERRKEVMSTKGWGQSMIDEAMERGIEKGLYEGIEKGILNMSLAVKMIVQGSADQQIMDETGIELSKIQEMRELMNASAMMVAEKQ